MKKILILTISVFSLSLLGCLKDTPNVDLSNIGTIIEFEYPGGANNSGLGSGLEYFGGGALTYPPTDLADTASFMVNIASPSPLDKDLTVTIGVDTAAKQDHYSVDSTIYVNMPDSNYKIITTSAIIKAGSRLAYFQIIFYPSKIDPSKHYGLPIKIASAGGYTISGNFGHIYFHTVVNPLFGYYTVTGTRYNYNGTVSWAGPPAPIPSSFVATTDLSAYSPKLGLPDNAFTIEIPFANVGTGVNYILTGSTDYSALSVDFTFDKTYSNIVTYLISYTPPAATPTPGKPAFHIITHYNNALAGAGNDRIMDETFVHQ